MRLKHITILSVTLLLLGSFTAANAVTNGQPDGNSHPYVGLLIFDIYVPDVGNVPTWECTGFLIAPDVVLTAGHCTDGADAARIWFDEELQDDEGNFLVPDFPDGGIVAVEGTPYTHPDFGSNNNPNRVGNGLPAFAYRDVGIVELDQPVDMDEMAILPDVGLVDMLRNKTAIDIVGYGVQEQLQGLPPWFWGGPRSRLYAPSQLVSGNFVHSAEFIRLSFNPGGGTGGYCFGDSGGPDLLADTNTVLAVNSYVTNYNCSGVGYSSRVDIPEVLDWINSFLKL